MNKVTFLRVVVRAKYLHAEIFYCNNVVSRTVAWVKHPRTMWRVRRLLRLWQIGRHEIEA